MFLIDTNLLVYAAHTGAREHKPCRELLERCRRQPEAWYLSWPILYEFLRVCTHPQVFEHPWSFPQAWAFVEGLLASSSLQILVQTERHSAVAKEIVQEFPMLAGNVLHDAHTAILMKEHGVRRIYTHDTDFHRFSFLEVIDPLK